MSLSIAARDKKGQTFLWYHQGFEPQTPKLESLRPTSIPWSLEKRDRLGPDLLRDEGQLRSGFVDDEASELVVQVDVAEGADVAQVEGVGQAELVPDLQN